MRSAMTAAERACCTLLPAWKESGVALMMPMILGEEKSKVACLSTNGRGRECFNPMGVDREDAKEVVGCEITRSSCGKVSLSPMLFPLAGRGLEPNLPIG